MATKSSKVKTFDEVHKNALESIALKACVLAGFKEQKKLFALCMPVLEQDAKSFDNILIELLRASAQAHNVQMIKAFESTLSKPLESKKLTQMVGRMITMGVMPEVDLAQDWLKGIEQHWGIDYGIKIGQYQGGMQRMEHTFLELCALHNATLLPKGGFYGWDKKSVINPILKNALLGSVWQQASQESKNVVFTQLCMQWYKSFFMHHKGVYQRIAKNSGALGELTQVLEHISADVQLDQSCILGYHLSRTSQSYEPTKRTALDFLPGIYLLMQQVGDKTKQLDKQHPLWSRVVEKIEQADTAQVLRWLKLTQSSLVFEVQKDPVQWMHQVLEHVDPKHTHRASGAFWHSWIDSDSVQHEMLLHAQGAEQKVIRMPQSETDNNNAPKSYQIQVPHWSLGYKCLKEGIANGASQWIAPEAVDVQWLPMLLTKHIQALQNAGKTAPKLLYYHVMGNTLQYSAQKQHKVQQLEWMHDQIKQWKWNASGKEKLSESASKNQQRWNQELQTIVEFCQTGVEQMRRVEAQKVSECEAVYARFIEQAHLLASSMSAGLVSQPEALQTKKRILKA